MSRWTEKFNKGAIKESLEQLKSKASEIALPDEAEPTNEEEYNRLLLAIDYIGGLLSNMSPELTPINITDSINNYLDGCHSNIDAFLQNPHDFSHLHNANQNIDDLIANASPFAFMESKKRKVAVNAFQAYLEETIARFKNLRNEAKSLIRSIRDTEKGSETAYEEIKSAEAAAQDFQQKTLKSSGGENSLESLLENFGSQAKAQCDAIENYHNKLMEGENSIVSQIGSTKTEIADELATVKEETDELHSFHGEIFGTEEKEGTGKKGGLKQEIEEQKANLETLRKNAEKTYSMLEQKINGLLPGAASAGLAKAYHDLKKKSESEAIKHTKMFYASLCTLLILPITVQFLFEKYISKGGGSNEIITITSMLNTGMFGDLFNKILLLSPILWLAVFSAKRRSEARRLQEEYAHKEALAKSYTGYKTEAEKLEEGGDKTLMRQLLAAAIKAISFNASTTLDKKHGDKTPLHEIAEGAAGQLKIKKWPK